MRKEIYGIILFFQVIFTLISLISYSPLDPSINHVGAAGPVHNLFGFVGAQVAGLLIALFGLGALWIPLLLLLASILEEEEGVPTEKIASELAKITPFSLSYIEKLLPEKYKAAKKRPRRTRKHKSVHVCTELDVGLVRHPRVETEATETVAPSEASAVEAAAAPVEAPAAPAPTPPAPAAPIEAGRPAAVPVSKPSARPRRPAIPRTFTCPRCHVEVKTLYCSKCFSELSIRDVAKILKRMEAEAS